jgi:hypothetical protein
MCPNIDVLQDNARPKVRSRSRLALLIGPLGVAVCALALNGCSASASAVASPFRYRWQTR